MTPEEEKVIVVRMAGAICESSCITPACNPRCKDCVREAQAAFDIVKDELEKRFIWNDERIYRNLLDHIIAQNTDLVGKVHIGTLQNILGQIKPQQEPTT